MAAIHVTTSSVLASFLPRLSPSSVAVTSRTATVFSRQLSHPFLPSLAFAIPSAIHLNVPTLLGDLWESILRAVPKKKTSHMKKRHRQMAGKALKDVTSLNKCSACGHIKRAHLLCPYCVAGMKPRRWPFGTRIDKFMTEIQGMFKKDAQKSDKPVDDTPV